ncbi:uncharacterized protein LOC6545888 isoform X1 [Drosophila erecta]|uniref:Uncharacterized protein n=1 Tax=Drosophila erecta TaxID=7220 RepID=B3NE32_DROER|nr:uncharacterized protein LOC6545888 isoform X1 [Drosophila erecta]EDV52456.1 uncharacterized protein Dere_GG13345 [Drosophila erecta]
MGDDSQRFQFQLQAVATVFLLVSQLCFALPYASSSGNDIESEANPQNSGSGRPVDYHTVVGHFKDFFMYLPVMMTTLKETMSGFPKFAEGMRILTSGRGRVDGEDCKCSQNGLGSGELLDASSRFG